ncbi:hypothetical protein BDP27DRAFT_1312638 [Rhodocollybia butyracea]|uniref:Uncharacterized protein n=1 Tax=Rhodocollybia butyracea TaxID=206335 RepID=A0A9P5UE32_9AGAR|nr:hypothetical protein BDP27DRAFT_1312638 [Rhodocollybia butyracea]
MRQNACSRDDASWGNNGNRQSSVPSPPLPRALMDGTVPSTVHRADLFFSSTAPAPSIPHSRPLSRSSRSYTARTSRASPSPNRPRTTSSPGPDNRHTNSTPPPPLPPPPPLKIAPQYAPELPVKADFQAALELSKSDSNKQTLFLEKLSSQEEDDLAKALEASMRISEPYTSLSSPGAGPSKSSAIPDYHPRQESQSVPSSSRHSSEAVPLGGASSTRRLSSATDQPLWSSLQQNHVSILDDEALARQLAAEEEREVARWENPQPSLEDDEAFARRLALEEEAEDKPPETTLAASVASPLPPAYIDAVSPPPSSRQVTDSSLPRTNSSASSTFSSSENVSKLPFQPLRAGSEDNISEKAKHSVSSASLTSPKEQSESEQTGPVNVNQFVDKELLRGVSIGFYDPVVQDQPQPMPGVMPNIVSLPYGKSPPLHLQATSWRHLLKLMARLSGTRLEPTPQATQRGVDLHLRTVIQFVRPHYDSPTWRTVLWFTIDQDAERPILRRSSTSNVDGLPFSYSQMKLPALLRDGSDSPISKTYNIPSTASVPFPILPISFPNLTLYLQAALDESRRYFNDSSSGMRKFAKMLEICYPDEFDGGTAPAERSGMSGLFKKVIGRGSKSSKKGRGGNEETYDLVTPFVPDEWG